jgi:hypothetical protein
VRFTEINLFGVYVAPMSLMMVAAWVVTIGLRCTLLHGSVVRRRGMDGISGTPFLTADHHRAIQSQPRSPSSHPEATAQSDELGCL